MRRTLALVAVVLVSALTAVVMGEYVLTLWTAVASGLVLGVLLTEIVLGIAHWRGVLPALFTGASGAAALAWAGWIESGHGVAPYRATVWICVLLAAAVGAWRLWPRRARHSRAAVSG
jgi:hypothetical protein